MAGPETPNSKQFIEMMQGYLSEAEFTSLQRRGKDLSGFKGEMADEIEKWQAEGLGRAIGYPLPAGNQYGELADSSYHGVMYALPLNDKRRTSFAKRVLLVIPNEISCSYMIVGPRDPKANDKAIRKWEETKALNDFDLHFEPSQKPNIHSSWRPAPGQKPENMFAERSDEFSFVKVTDKHLVSDAKKQEAILAKALANARKLKLIREVVLEPGVAQTLDSISKEFDEWGKDLGFS